MPQRIFYSTLYRSRAADSSAEPVMQMEQKQKDSEAFSLLKNLKIQIYREFAQDSVDFIIK